MSGAWVLAGEVKCRGLVVHSLAELDENLNEMIESLESGDNAVERRSVLTWVPYEGR